MHESCSKCWAPFFSPIVMSPVSLIPRRPPWTPQLASPYILKSCANKNHAHQTGLSQSSGGHMGARLHDAKRKSVVARCWWNNLCLPIFKVFLLMSLEGCPSVNHKLFNTSSQTPFAPIGDHFTKWLIICHYKSLISSEQISPVTYPGRQLLSREVKWLSDQIYTYWDLYIHT